MAVWNASRNAEFAFDATAWKRMLAPMQQSVITRVPGTTANLGPGFDSLGIALGLSNEITVSRSARREHPAVFAGAADAFFKAADIAPFGFDWKIEGEVPQSRGLGSSVTVRLGVMHGLNALCESPLNRDALFELCADLEGHPDNAAPAAFGGFAVSRAGAETIRCEVAPELKFVLLIPDFEVSTPMARSILPDGIPRRDAVMSASNACRITAAFLTKRYDLLRGSFGDGLHQPYRQRLIPFLYEVIGAAESAGAIGGFLSGSGSTICCVTLENAEGIAAAMKAASGNEGASTLIRSADNRGATVIT
jgi:homoserine kinase